MKLDDTITAIVTGGASGLGEATARRLASRGVKVTIFDMNEEAGAAVADDIGGLFQSVDVTDVVSVEAGFTAARTAHGPARILVNCAGIAPPMKTTSRHRETGDVRMHDLALFAKIIAINLTGTFNCIAHAAADMVDCEPLNADGEKGLIVNTSSVAAEDGQIGQVAYAASKGGVKSLTLPVARDLAREGVRVNTILPGMFHTPLFDALPPAAVESLSAAVPFPSRLGQPDEYAALVIHMAENAMLNAATIRLDGATRMAPK